MSGELGWDLVPPARPARRPCRRGLPLSPGACLPPLSPAILLPPIPPPDDRPATFGTAQLAERRKGNEAYRARRWEEALRAYTRAAAVVEFVEGLSRADQAEVEANRVAVYCNLAALHLATQAYGEAVAACDKALALDPGCAKARLRRAKANAGRHAYAQAEADLAALDAAAAADPGLAAQAREARDLLTRARLAAAASERAAFGSMFAAQAPTPCGA